MELLTAVNLILPKLGEHSVTSLSVKHPTLSIILPSIQQMLDRTLARGLWFNTVPEYKLYPDGNGKIAVPADTLSFVSADKYTAIKGLELLNMETGLNSWDGPVTGAYIYRVAFEDLPEVVAQAVFYAALVDVYLTDIGLENIVQAWQQMAREAATTMEAEHLRHRKYSTRHSPRYSRLVRALRG